MADTTVNVPGAAPGEKPEQPGRKPREEVVGEAQEGERELQEELDESGEAKEYVETFKESRNFEIFTMWLEQGMTLGDTEGSLNFETWLTKDPQQLAEFFDQFQYAPRGKGRQKFVEGLRAEAESDEFKGSQDVVQKLVNILREHFEIKRKAGVDIQAQVTRSPMGDTIGNGVNTLMRNFKRAPGTEKLMILAAVGIGIILINKYKDDKVPFTKDTKWSSVFMMLGAAWGVNYLSGKVSKDGRTLLQRMDVMRDIDDMSEDGMLRGYAEDLKMGEDQERLKTLHQLIYKGVSAKRLFELYEEAELATEKNKTIDPRALGFYKNEIDGKATYELMDTLVKQTSVNEYTRLRHKEAQDTGVKYTPPNKDAIAAWEQPGVAIDAFKAKYVNGELGANDLTYFDVVMNEINAANREEAARRGISPEALVNEKIAAGKAARKPDWIGGKIKKGAEAVKEWAQDEKRWGGKWVYLGVAAGANRAWEFSRDEILIPSGQFIARKYRTLAAPQIKRGVDWLRQGKINEVVPTDFAADVTAENQVTIMGLPGNNFEIEVGKGEVIINGVTFEIDKGVDGNSINARLLETDIKKKVDALINSKNIPQLKGKKPKWDATHKEWTIERVEVDGNDLLGIGTPDATGRRKAQVDVAFTIDSDGKNMRFYDGEKEIADFRKIENIHRDAEIEKAVWNADPKLKQHLEGLAVQVDDVQASPAHTFIIQGRIAGLKFFAVPKAGKTPATLANGLQFYNSATGVGGFEKVQITEANGAAKFLDELGAKILASGEFLNPFFDLESLMDQTGEGVWTRLSNAFRTTRFWVVPTNIPEAINGRVLQRQWKYLLDFKKRETVEFFTEQLNGKSVADIESLYKKYIDSTLRELERLAEDIRATSDDQKVEQFPRIFSRLETTNYTNPDYRKLFEEYRKMITNANYNYEGIETFGDISVGKWGAADKAYRIYQVLLDVWSYHTREFAIEDPMAKNPKNELHADTQTKIRRGVIDRVRSILDQHNANGTITMDELPKHETSSDMAKWVDPTYLAPQRRRSIFSQGIS